MKHFRTVALIALTLTVTGCGKHEAGHDTGHDVAHDAGAVHEQSHDDAATASDTHDAHDAHDAHEGHAEHTVTPTLSAGQRWPTDAPLREAMLNIRSAVEKAEVAHASSQLSASNASALVASIDQNVKYMFANCKLAPEPDAALHALIVRMMNAASALKNDALSADGVPQLQRVLHDYQSTFDHPGWDDSKHEH